MNTLTRTLLIILSLHVCLTQHCRAADPVLDSLLHSIDTAIDNYPVTVKAKTSRLATLTAALAKALTAEQRYGAAYNLYTEYLPFNNDSALHYLNVCSRQAELAGNPSKAGGCRALAALCCSNAGMYTEAFAILEDIDATQLHGNDLGNYYYAYSHVCGEVTYYAKIADIRNQYGSLAAEYRAQMYATLPADNQYVRQSREVEALTSNRNKESKAINDAWLQSVAEWSHEYALVAFYRYLEFKSIGNDTEMMRWIAKSALADVRNCVMDQGSMWELANMLMLHGDVDRAYKYICFTSDCANSFGSRQRLSHISPLLTQIAQSYKAELDRSSKKLRTTICIISIMALLLLALLFYVVRQRNRLAATRDDLAKSYSLQSALNAQLQSLNAQLKTSNAHLSSLNTQLSEANSVKEEYVGRFMRLCSLYIDRLDDLRKKVNKKVKNKEYAALYEMTRTGELRKKDMDELYANFDSAFVHLYPTFVDDFNALLRPECRITLTNRENLNTVVRIFALIRLGINDSGKIAEFLHYSVNTIYNYRAQIKNAALGDRNEFENRVRLLGIPKESQETTNQALQ